MSMSNNSGLTSITGSVSVLATNSLPSPNANQTIVNAKLSNAASGSTIYTVTAGKTFYMTGFQFYNGNAFCSAVLSNCNIINTVNAAQTNTMTGGILASFPAGTAITVTTGQAGNYATIWGFEQ